MIKIIKMKTIVQLFNNNVLNKAIDLSKYNANHCGKEGHWLEKKMGLEHNSKNQPDIMGYEMKKMANKITYGDYGASEYLFSKQIPHICKINNWNNKPVVTRDKYIQYFGNYNEKKKRYSWSGICVPKYGYWNSSGQKLEYDKDNNLCVYYSNEYDQRKIKSELPLFLTNQKQVVIAYWTYDKLSNCINSKYNINGFFICMKDNITKEEYTNIRFGQKFDYNFFMKNLKEGNIIFDSGMYQGNNRNYSCFRSSFKFWQTLLQ